MYRLRFKKRERSTRIWTRVATNNFNYLNEGHPKCAPRLTNLALLNDQDSTPGGPPLVTNS